MNQKKIITTLAIAGVVAGAGAHHIQAQNVNRAQSNTQVKYVVTQSHQVDSSNSVINLAAQNVIGTVTNLQGAKTANVRKQGGMNSPVIMKLKAGTKVKVLAEDGGWYKIEYNGTTGWIYSNLLSVNGKVPGQSTVKQSAKFKGKVGTVVNLGSNESLNVRSNGTTNAPIVTTLPEGTHVKVLNENGGWYQIEYNGVTGWVYSGYLQVGAASSSNTTSNSTSSSKPSSSTSNSTSSSKPSSTTNSTQKYIKVNSPIGLWLLQSPSMQGNKIEAMPNNAVLKVLGTSSNGNWTKVEYNGIVGWCYSEYTSAVSANNSTSSNTTNSTSSTNTQSTIKVNSPVGLWLLQSPSMQGKQIQVMPNGASLKVLGTSANGLWTKVEYNGVVGWCYTQYTSAATNNATSSNTTNSTSSTSTQSTIKVNSPIGLWLLQSPSMQGNKIEAMPNNAVLKVLGTSSNGNWTKVEYNGIVGWCYSEYTSAVSANNSTSSNTTNSTSSTNTQSTIKVNSPVGLWLLQSPSMQGKQIQVMPNGASLKVLGTSANGLWTKVEYNGVTGWCYTQYTSAATNNAASSNTTNSTNSTSSQTSASVTSPIGLWLLQSPSMQGQKIEVMPNGASLKVLGTSANGSWIKVQYNGITGWCYKEYTTMNNSNSSSNSTSSSSSSSTSNSASSTSQTTTTSIGTVVNVPSGYYLHLRTQPNTQSKIIKSLTEGSHVIILGQSNGWYKVDINGTIGYVSGAYLTQTTGITTGVVANLGGAPYLHMRAGGDPYTAIIKDLPAGTRVNILSNNGGWYNIEYHGLIGYVYSAYINTGAAASNPSGSVQSANGVVTVMSPVGLYMNNGPAAGTGIITAIPYMTNVKVSAVQNGWYKVSYNGMTGWIDGAYVTAGIANQGSSLN